MVAMSILYAMIVSFTPITANAIGGFKATLNNDFLSMYSDKHAGLISEKNELMHNVNHVASSSYINVFGSYQNISQFKQ